MASTDALGDGSNVKAVLFFDMDGTLVKAESNHVHREAFSVAIKEVYGIDCIITEVDHSGRPDSWIITALLAKHGVTDEATVKAGLPKCFSIMSEEVRERRQELNESLKVLPGVPALMRALSRRDDVLVGLVTGNLTGIAMTKCVCMGLDQYFSCGGFGEDSTVRHELVTSALARARAKFANLPPVDQLKIYVIGDTPHDLHAAAGANAALGGAATAGDVVPSAAAVAANDSSSASTGSSGPATTVAPQAGTGLRRVFGVGVATGSYTAEQLRALPCGHHAVLESFVDIHASMAALDLELPANWE